MSRENIKQMVCDLLMACRPTMVSRETIKIPPFDARETFFKLETYVSLLIKWQKVQNLISPNTLDDIWGRHIYDCLQLLPHLSGQTAVDFGTGAGLPGLVLAIARPDIEFQLVESNLRKCAFLNEAARQTGTKVKILPIRAEEYSDLPDICMARAMTALPELLTFAQPIVQNGGYALFPKGKTYQEELTLAAKSFTIAYEILKNVSRETTFNLHASTIIKITKIESK